jgi:hypothetical protein
MGKTLFAGKVLADRERNFYDDSDFYVVVFDGELKTYEYGSTRYASRGYAEVDATEEVKQAAEKWLEDWAFNQLGNSVAEEARKPEKGKRVRVVKGRKVPLGTEGILFWMQTKTYGINRVTTAGIRLEDGSVVFTNIANLEVVDPENYLESLVEIQEKAKKFAKKRNWHIPFVRAGMIAL